MFREDYILRVIEQATATLAKTLGLKEAQRYSQALAEIDQALQHFWGLGAGLISQMSAADLIALARWGEALDIGKLIVLADLLQAEGDVYATQGMAVWGADRYLKALEVLLETAFIIDQANWPDLAPRVKALADRIGSSEIPSETNERLAYYLEQVEQRSGG